MLAPPCGSRGSSFDYSAAACTETAATLSACLLTVVLPGPKPAALLSACLLHIDAACLAIRLHASHWCSVQADLRQTRFLQPAGGSIWLCAPSRSTLQASGHPTHSAWFSRLLCMRKWVVCRVSSIDVLEECSSLPLCTARCQSGPYVIPSARFQWTPRHCGLQASLAAPLHTVHTYC